LQPILAGIISLDQTTFIPTRFILDNILLLHETISWAKESEQEAILLKLDFQKAYDTVHLPFLFKVMETMGIPSSFVDLVKLLLAEVEASVCINGVASSSFPVLQGVKQSCLLAPYLFLFVGEALNIAARHLRHEGELKGISLPSAIAAQLISQYANDVNFTIKGEEKYFRQLSLLLDRYGVASRLMINWSKSLAYWHSPHPAPPWLAQN